MTMDASRRWIALYVLCLATLMIVLDMTIVNVALPSIKADLGFSETSLAWVVNAYLLTYGGCLLLGGRPGDLLGHRRLFLIGIVLFTLASLACGVATTQGFLVAARAVQGVGGAVASAVSLSLMMMLFTGPAGARGVGSSASSRQVAAASASCSVASSPTSSTGTGSSSSTSIRRVCFLSLRLQDAGDCPGRAHRPRRRRNGHRR
jgi:MFS family permease